MIRFVLALVLLASTSHALPLRNGTLEFDNVSFGDGPVYLRGKHFVFDGWARYARLDAVDCSYPCDGGETVSLYMFANDLVGIATFEDVQYTDFNPPNGVLQLRVEIKGRMKLPQIRDKEQASKSALVRIRVTFVHEQVPLLQPLTEIFVGDAIATVTLRILPEEYDGKKQWFITHLAYDIVS